MEFNGEKLGDTLRASRVRETGHPPAHCIPEVDGKMEFLRPKASRSFCEYKGEACDGDLHAGAGTSIAAAWG